MEIISENLSNNDSSIGASINRIEALKTLTKLLLQEVEILGDISPAKNQISETNFNLTDKVQNYEINLICHALVKAKGNQRKAAKILGMKTTTLHAKIKRYEIDSMTVFGRFTN